MKLTMPAKDFAHAVAWTGRLLPARPVVPILAGLRLTAHSEGVEVAGFDYETAARARVDADVAEPGTVLVPGRLLAHIAAQLPADAEISLAATDATLHLACGSGTYELPLMALEDHPALPDPGTTIGTVDGAALATAIARTTPATGRNDALPWMACLHLAFTGEAVLVEGTDRYRYARQRLPWTPSSTERPEALLVEAAPVAAAIRGMDDAEFTLSVAHGEDGAPTSLGMAGGTRSLVLRLSDDASWPDGDGVLGQIGENTVLTAPIAQLREAIKRVAAFTEGARTAFLPVVLEMSADAVTVHTTGQNGGYGREQVSAACSGAARTLHFNPRFLAEALALLPGTELQLNVGSDQRTLLTADGDDAYQHLLMAIRPQ